MEVVFRVSSYLIEQLEDIGTCGLRGIFEDTAGYIVVLPTDEVENDLDLTRGDADMLLGRFRFHFLIAPPS